MVYILFSGIMIKTVPENEYPFFISTVWDNATLAIQAISSYKAKEVSGLICTDKVYRILETIYDFGGI